MFVDWYEGQGEQDADVWFSENDLEAPYVHIDRKGGWKEVKEDEIIVYCK